MRGRVYVCTSIMSLVWKRRVLKYQKFYIQTFYRKQSQVPIPNSDHKCHKYVGTIDIQAPIENTF